MLLPKKKPNRNGTFPAGQELQEQNPVPFVRSHITLTSPLPAFLTQKIQTPLATG